MPRHRSHWRVRSPHRLNIDQGPQAKVTNENGLFRPWKSAEPEEFARDGAQSSFVATPSDNLRVLLEQFTC